VRVVSPMLIEKFAPLVVGGEHRVIVCKFSDTGDGYCCAFKCGLDRRVIFDELLVGWLVS